LLNFKVPALKEELIVLLSRTWSIESPTP